MRAPRLLAAGAATASLLVLTACEEPTPLVTLVSGGQSVHSEAASYCFEGQDSSRQPGTEGGCSLSEERPELLRVQPGEQVGVDVSKEIADKAWIIVVSPQAGQGQQQQEQASPVQDEHYFTFTPQFEGGAPLDVQVRSLSGPQADAQVTGVWRFVLAPE